MRCSAKSQAVKVKRGIWHVYCEHLMAKVKKERKEKMVKNIFSRVVVIFVSLFLALGIMMVNPEVKEVYAGDISSSYNELKGQYSGYVEKIIAGGATEAEIRNFLDDLDTEVKNRGTLTEANFNSVMFDSLKEVIIWEKHRAVFEAMLDSFPEEIDYTLKNNSLHNNLIPLRNAVKASVLNNGSTSETTTGPRGGGITPSSPVTKEIKKQLNRNEPVISLDLGKNDELSIEADVLKDINKAGKDIEVTRDGVKLTIPARALQLSKDNKLNISIQTLSESKAKIVLSKIAADKTVVGPVYEINLTTEESVSGVTFAKPVTVVLSYAKTDIEGLDEETLDAFYYNDGKKEWQQLKGELNTKQDTVTFTTTHFSKYTLMADKTQDSTAVVEPEPEPEKPLPQIEFNDLNGHWAEADIYKMVEMDLVKGVSVTEFAPQKNISRAEFVTLLSRAVGLQPGTLYKGRFYDVPADQWYFNIVNTAADAGLVSGYTATTFAPQDPVTREQMAVMIKRALAYKGKDVEPTTEAVTASLARFTDQNVISSWARTSVAAAVQQNIVSGRDNGLFAPAANATRAEAAVMILRMYSQM
ncbi:MAG: S-layer homology domain-containing protein [Syntrophomonadaceae bacterium]|nr:S-layer homology domain-containing protein [Syntrophomonadaceae bacterium]